jgi:hypothetical protein
MKENIHPIFGGNNTDAIKQEIKEFINALPQRLELIVVLARLQKAKYDALILEGFSEVQALELCKSVASTFL